MIQLLVLFLFRCGGIKMKGYKKSDPVINYPELALCSIEQIEQWLADKKSQDDMYAIKWYKHYLESEFRFNRERNEIDLCHKADVLISFIRCYCL